MNSEQQYQELLRRVQQKAETYKEQQQQAVQFQQDLDAVKEVYGLNDQELSDILKEVEQELEQDRQRPSTLEDLTEKNPLALNVASLSLLLVGMMLLFVAPLVGILFLAGVFALRWVR